MLDCPLMETAKVFPTKIQAINDAIADVSREGGGKVYVNADVDKCHPAYVIDVPPMHHVRTTEKGLVNQNTDGS